MERMMPTIDRINPALAEPFICPFPLDKSAKIMPSAPNMKEAPQQISTRQQMPMTRDAVASPDDFGNGASGRGDRYISGSGFS